MVPDNPDTVAVMDGEAVVYNSLSVDMFGFREQFSPGAFRESLGTRDIVALIDHQSSRIIGRQTAKTLRIVDTPEALKASIDIPNTSYGNDCVVSVRRRDQAGMSFVFDEIEDTWEFKKDGTILRTVQKAELYEVTITGFPAYPATSIGLRSTDSINPLYQPTLTLLERARSTVEKSTPEADWIDDRYRLLLRLAETSL
jgi:hypothetical protein